MGASFAQKAPPFLTMRQIATARATDLVQNQSKGTPCHVTKIDKDFVTVAFETHNSIFAMPTVKMPQSFSSYVREPTQVNDHGVATAADFYLGGVSGLGGGGTNFYPRGNLTPLSFQPISRSQNETRDYNQLTLTGGPNGVKIVQSLQQQNQGNTQPPASGSGSPPVATPSRSPISAAVLRYAPQRLGLHRPRAQPRDSSDSSTQKAYMQIDQNGVVSHVSADGKSVVTVDQQNKKIAVRVPADGNHNVFLGGTGKTLSLYAPVMCGGGIPAVNVMAKIVQQDD